MSEVTHLARAGIVYDAPRVDLDALRQHKNKIVGRLTGGLGAWQKKNTAKFEHIWVKTRTVDALAFEPRPRKACARTCRLWGPRATATMPVWQGQFWKIRKC